MTKRLLDALVAVIVLSIAVSALIDIVRPFAPFIILGAAAYIVILSAYKRWREW